MREWGAVYRYVMRGIDGSDAGEICLMHRVNSGDLLAESTPATPAIRVVTVLDFDEIHLSPFDGLIWIEDADAVGAGFELCLCRPRSGLPYFRYRLHWADGEDAGDAEYAVRIKPGELVWLTTGQQVRVLDVVDANGERYDGLLRVEPARYSQRL